MAAIEGGVSTLLAEVGLGASLPVHATIKPIPYGALGHYRIVHRFVLAATQAANSRLFSVRNPNADRLLIATRCTIRWIQTAAHTAAILDSLDVFKLTNYTAVDTTNTVALTPSVKKTTGMAAAAAAIIRGVTVAGAAAGMTGGTMTKDAFPFGLLPKWLLLAQPTAGEVIPSFMDVLDDVNGTHPFVFEQHQGFEIENRVLLGAAVGSEVSIDFSFAEATLY